MQNNNFIKSSIDEYYSVYDECFGNLDKYFMDDCLINYLNKEYSYIYDLELDLRRNSIYRFSHSQIKYVYQYIDNSTLLITINGCVALNNSPIPHKFTETLYLLRVHNLRTCNKFYIKSAIFQIIN